MNKTGKMFVSDDKNLLQIDVIHNFLKQSNWAAKRTKETIIESIENSLCFGVYIDSKQIGFARVVTDGCTFSYLCDVFVDENYRGQGASKELMKFIMAYKSLKKFRRFVLATENAHGLYAKFGFKNVAADKFMEIRNDDV